MTDNPKAQTAPAAYTPLEAEAALCIWEDMLERRGQRPHTDELELQDAWDIRGSTAMRHTALALAPYVLSVYDLLPQDLLDRGFCYAWETVPAIMSTVDWSTNHPVLLPPTEAAAKAAETLAAKAAQWEAEASDGPPPAPCPDAWHYDEAKREIRDENGLKVARDVLPEDAARIVAGGFVGIVQAEHWEVPGRPMNAFSSGEAAATGALGLVNLMRTELGMAAAADDWAKALEELKSELRRQFPGTRNDRECDVWIVRAPLNGANPETTVAEAEA